MPQLPSGRHFALDPAPLAELVRQVQQGKFVHALMALKTQEDAFGHIGVLYFRPRSGPGGVSVFADQSGIPPDQLEHYPSGFNLVTIQHELARWSADDRNAFLAFLREKRVHEYLEGLLEAIREAQGRLLDNPSTLPGLLATWWALGVHPLQDEAGDTSPAPGHGVSS